MKFKHCFMASCFLLLTTTASFAEVRELDSYTVDLPAQWDVEQQGQFWESYTAPGSSDLVHLVRGDYLFSDALLLARSLAARSRAGDSLRIMEDGRTFSFVKPNGDRVVLLESGGKTVMVTVVERHKRIPELLLGFTSRDPKLTKIFTALADTRMIDWLSFTSDVQPGADLHPAKARGMPDFSTYGTIEGEKGNPPPPTEEMPSDWEHKAIGLWTVAVAKDSEEWVFHGLPGGDAAGDVRSLLPGRGHSGFQAGLSKGPGGSLAASQDERRRAEYSGILEGPA